MKSSLAVIDRVFDDAVIAQLDNPPVPEKFERLAQKKTVIAGFEVHDKIAAEKAREEGRSERRKQLEAYRDARNALLAAFSDRGVKPLAVLPSGAWKRVCTDARLIILDRPDGTLLCDLNQSHEFIAALLTKWKPGRGSGVSDPLKYAQAWLDSKPWADLLRDMINGRGSKTPVRINLPVPPDDVVDVLCRVRDMEPKTAAVPEAISFADGAATVIARHHQARVEAERKEREYQEWLKNDPIVYVEKDGATGIVAQFGDFPIEQEVVEAVSKTEFFPEAALMATKIKQAPADDYMRAFQRQVEIERQRQMMMGVQQSQFSNSSIYQNMLGQTLANRSLLG